MSSVPDAVPQDTILRYSNVTVAFHWTTVALVLLQIWLGFAFHGAEPGPARAELFTWHKTVGALILLITVARLAYRLTNPPPPYAPDLPKWERIAGTWNHRLFYLLLIALPLGGLVAVSARAEGPTTDLAFGIPLPVIPGVSEQAGEIAGGVHVAAAFFLIAFIVLHAAAGLKHRFFDKYPSSARMPPFWSPDGRPTTIGQGSRSRRD
jgi:cytochrome b561